MRSALLTSLHARTLLLRLASLWGLWCHSILSFCVLAKNPDRSRLVRQEPPYQYHKSRSPPENIGITSILQLATGWHSSYQCPLIPIKSGFPRPDNKINFAFQDLTQPSQSPSSWPWLWPLCDRSTFLRRGIRGAGAGRRVEWLRLGLAGDRSPSPTWQQYDWQVVRQINLDSQLAWFRVKPQWVNLRNRDRDRRIHQQTPSNVMQFNEHVSACNYFFSRS